jgi:hypothetical protein
MRYLILAVVLLGVSVPGCAPAEPTREQSERPSDSDQVLRRAFEQRTSKLEVEGQGVVQRILSDDNDGSRHQRFILELGSGQTLLVAHNIDVAPRIPDLREGDKVAFRGEYEWNAKGGAIHWTHHDPAGRHWGGWLEHKGKTYH